MFGFHFSPGQKNQPKSKTVSKPGNSTRRFNSYLPLARKMVCRIDLRKVIVNIDTDDVVLNAQLIPVCVLLSSRNRDFGVNFYGRFYFHLEATVYLYQLLYEFISFKLKQFRYGT